MIGTTQTMRRVHKPGCLRLLRPAAQDQEAMHMLSLWSSARGSRAHSACVGFVADDNHSQLRQVQLTFALLRVPHRPVSV